MSFGYFMTYLLKLLYVCCSLLLVVAATAPNFAAQVNSILMLSGLNFKSWKESAEIFLGCMDMDVSLRENRPVNTYSMAQIQGTHVNTRHDNDTPTPIFF